MNAESRETVPNLEGIGIKASGRPVLSFAAAISADGDGARTFFSPRLRWDATPLWVYGAEQGTVGRVRRLGRYC